MADSVKHLEDITRVTPLGLRFWDDVTGQVISEGLEIVAYSRSNPERRIPATTNRAGVFILQNLPGLNDSETGSGDESYWSNPPIKRKFLIELNDTQRRFLPYQFEVELPHKGLFDLHCISALSPPETSGFLPLFSSPSRGVPGAMAVFRAQLWDMVLNVNAAWARVEISSAGLAPKVGLADEKGRVAIIFPYPPPIGPRIGSPPHNGMSLFDQTWELQIQAFYDSKKEDNIPTIPDLCQVFQQNSATLIKSISPETPLTQVMLEYGKELVVKTEGQSELYLIPTGSPI